MDSTKNTGCSGGGAQPIIKPTKGSVKNIIAVGSGKGGVGKSTVSALLSVALAKKGHNVGILDADVTGPSIPKLLGVSGYPTGGKNNKILPLQSSKYGISVMSVNLLLDDPTKPVVWRGPLIGNVIRQFWTDVEWGNLDYLVVDLPPGTADAPLTVMQFIAVDGMVIVTSPQELSVLIVEKQAKMTEMMDIPILGVVENMSYATCPHCGERMEIFGPSHRKEIEEKFGIPTIARIPVDTAIADLGDQGKLEEYDNAELLSSLIEGVGDVEGAEVH